MDAYYGYDLDSNRGLGVLEGHIILCVVSMKAAADIIRGHPCADELIDTFPSLAEYL